MTKRYIRYTTSSTDLLIEAVGELRDNNLPFIITDEKTLSFRAKPCRSAKIILNRHGFIRGS